MKMVTIVGARPQFIKAAAVSRAIQVFNRRSPSFGQFRPRKEIREILVHTGQHYDYLMDKVFFEELELPIPNYHLGVGSGSHAQQTGRMLERIEVVLQRETPDVVMVYGDTNSTLAGALASVKLNIPVAHIEAGLRSYNRAMPEEINRTLSDHVSTLLFCPTDQSIRNLITEGIRDGKEKTVKKVGDVMYDSILHYSKLANKHSSILNKLGLSSSDQSSTPTFGPRTSNYYLVTLHRAENTDNSKKLKSIFKALIEIGKEIPVVLPLHPRTRKRMETHRLFPLTQKIKLIDPVSYFDMLKLEMHAKAILTDSGGVQKEAYWFNVPCFTLREETEWVETIQQGWNRLVGTDIKRIVEAVSRFKWKPFPRIRPTLYGNGKASEKIVENIAKRFSVEE